MDVRFDSYNPAFRQYATINLSLFILGAFNLNDLPFD
jgi:hypothetical protein